MNFLQLCQRLRQEAGATGTGPTSVLGQTGEYARLVSYVQQAWIELQEEHQEWDWLRRSVSFDTILYQQSYPPTVAPLSLTDFARWKKDSFRYYWTATGYGSEVMIPFMEYGAFRDFYLFGTKRTTYSQPINISIDPQTKALLLGHAPNQQYTIVGEYFSTPITLAADADTPVMPSMYHMAIVYKAMMAYGSYEVSPEVIARGQAGLNTILHRMELDQLQQISTASPLV